MELINVKSVSQQSERKGAQMLHRRTNKEEQQGGVVIVFRHHQRLLCDFAHVMVNSVTAVQSGFNNRNKEIRTFESLYS